MPTVYSPAPPGTAGSPVTRADTAAGSIARLLPYLLAGAWFGIVLVQSQVVSWFRIQEMFRFQSFHMYGILGTAMVTAGVSVRLLKRFRIRSLTGEEILIPPKQLGSGHRYWIGGTIFGLGWALTGTCPGPMFALVGSGASCFVVVAAAALAGTWSYGVLRSRLPH
jgi:hypothetical protein